MVREVMDIQRGGDWEGYGPEERSWVSSRLILDPALLTGLGLG